MVKKIPDMLVRLAAADWFKVPLLAFVLTRVGNLAVAYLALLGASILLYKLVENELGPAVAGLRESAGVRARIIGLGPRGSFTALLSNWYWVG